jgi:hypothetical protein
MAKRQAINISKKAYFIAIAAVFIFSIAASAFVTNFAPQYATYLRHLSNATTTVLGLMAVYRLSAIGYPIWLGILIAIFFLLVIPFVVVIATLQMGIRSVDPQFQVMVLGTVIYTIIFLIVVGVLPDRSSKDAVERHDRIEPRF